MRSGYTRKELDAGMRQQIVKSKSKAIAGMLELYAYQTEDEQESKDTKYRNSVGFDKADAKSLSYISEKLMSRKMITEKEMCIVMKAMPKYAKQLVSLSIRKGSIKKEGKSYFIK